MNSFPRAATAASSTALSLFLLLSASVAVSGCGKGAGSSGEITQVAPASPDDLRVKPNLSNKERLRVQDMVGGKGPHGGMGGPMAGGPMGAPGGDVSGAASPNEFTFTTPEGWQAVGATPMRAVNLKAGADVECYVSVLGGSGGGLASNLNRWRKQMGQEPLSEADVAALPKRPLLGQEASFITIDGAFSGMGTEAKPGYRMLGLCSVTDKEAVFVKLTGPQAEVEKQAANFDVFTASLKRGEAPAHVHAEAPAAAPAAAAPAASAPPMASAPASPKPTDNGIFYAVPTGWIEEASSPMRPVNLKAGAESECYVSILGGTGGGLAANLNRWRKQMGQGELSEADVAALPKRTLLGKEATLISIDGAFSGMGTEAKAGYRMLGLVQVDDKRAVFVKLVGPQAEVEKEAGNFDAFVASLSEGKESAPPAAAPAPAAAAPAPAPAATPAPAAAPAAAPAMAQVAPPQGGGIDAAKLQYVAPPSWQKGPEKMMRLVTFNVGSSECYITALDGPAGGVNPNLNRWRAQMGQPDLSADDIEKLPTLKVMGKDAKFVQVNGTYTTMAGEPLPGQTLLGVVCQLDHGLMTVKMTGPESEIAAELENFKSFCSSIAGG